MRRRVFRRWGGVLFSVPIVFFGLMVAGLGVSELDRKFGANGFATLAFGVLILVLPWLTLLRPRFQVSRRGVAMTSAFSRTTVPFSRLRKVTIPPESEEMVVVTTEGEEFPVFAFGPSLISTWMGNRREKRILALVTDYQRRIQELGAAPDARDEVRSRLDPLPIVFPILVLLAFIACVIIATR